MESPGANVTIREADTIWHEEGGWFDARWHFSFDRYRDPEQLGVGALRVFNDDRIIAGAEWPLHPHRDIESLTYVVSGHFLHADSLGNNGELEAGAAQVMTFSHRGDEHSEKNGSATEGLRFIQFWILPSTRDLETSVQQRPYTLEDRPIAGSRSWVPPAPTASTWPRTPARSSPISPIGVCSITSSSPVAAATCM